MSEPAPQPLGYATPAATRRRPVPRFDGLPLALGIVQLVLAAALLTQAGGDGKPATVAWFVRVAYGWLNTQRAWAVATAVGGGLLVAGALRPAGGRRVRLYVIYGLIWPVLVGFSLACFAIVGPWPGEWRSRTVLVHNLSAEMVTADDVRLVLFVAVVLWPAVPVQAARAVYRLLRRTPGHS